jgi:predicted GIY-YIG superfamily endonuclease
MIAADLSIMCLHMGEYSNSLMGHEFLNKRIRMREIEMNNEVPVFERKKLQFYGGGRRTGLRYHRGSTMVVYALCDPRDGTARYIGITNNMLARYNEHLRLNGPNERKQAWLTELLDAHLLPIMHNLEVVEVYEEARDREVAWIEAYIAAGADLLNDEAYRYEAAQEGA